MQLSGRNFVKSGAEEYSMGFQGQEEDDEIKGEGNSVSYEYRIEDPRLGRFFAIDPLTAQYPHNSPYAFSENRVIDAVELEGKECILIHGTNMSSGKHMFDDVAREEFMRIGGNTSYDDTYSWGPFSATNNSRDNERKMMAFTLALHVLKIRDQQITDGIITEAEPITLVGYSHGGNIAIQAADMIQILTGVKVQLITYATPAYNDGSIEDPTTQDGISKHIHLFSTGDGVDDIAGGDEYYANSKTVNIEIPESIIPHNGSIDTHTEMGSKYSNKKLGGFLKEKVKSMSEIPKFNRTKTAVDHPSIGTVKQIKKNKDGEKK